MNNHETQMAAYMQVQGHNVPRFVYGTAWKELDTERLTSLALQAGFRGIDTANQRKHYYEAGVGAAVALAIEQGLVQREDLFLQTKFTFVDGQDHRLPYNPKADYATQVAQSFASSLEHLRTDYLDSYVLHGPSRRFGLGKEDLEVWAAMEERQLAGQTRFLGVSNIGLDQLEALCAQARVKPSFVQNRCFARTGWDVHVRAFCRKHSMVYQGFSLLTANVRELQHPAFAQLLRKTGMTPAQAVFCFAMQTGMQPLTGTTDPKHMQEDLQVYRFSLLPEELELIENLHLSRF